MQKFRSKRHGSYGKSMSRKMRQRDLVPLPGEEPLLVDVYDDEYGGRAMGVDYYSMCVGRWLG